MKRLITHRDQPLFLWPGWHIVLMAEAFLAYSQQPLGAGKLR